MGADDNVVVVGVDDDGDDVDDDGALGGLAVSPQELKDGLSRFLER